LRDYNLCISCGRCVRACQQLRGVYALGAVINDGKLIIGSVGGTNLYESECRFCGACAEVCPTGAIQDIKKPRLKEYSDYLPCRANCPGDVDIPSYLRFIAEGDYQKSAEIISHSLSFPNTLGKICFHPCESGCRRNYLINENTDSNSISIRAAKDFAMSHSTLKNGLSKQNNTGRRIAIIGSGPAGLTAAFYLSLKGHNVTVFEKEEKIGGMLRYGIPRYRLSDEILNKDISWILQSGINIRTGVSLGSNISLSSLLDDNFEAILIATGLSKSKHLPIEISKSDNILYGVEFLNQVVKGNIASNYFELKSVIVIGGGNVATDAARTAVRLGASKVTIICLEKFYEMPAYKEEIKESIEEGIEILNGWGIERISDNEENNLIINLKKCLEVFDESGKFNPRYDESEKHIRESNKAIICIGQEADETLFQIDSGKDLFYRGMINTKLLREQAKYEGIFAAGDIYYGPASVIDAVASGKKAAREIDVYLGGDGVLVCDENLNINYEYRKGRIQGFCYYKRVPVQIAEAAQRVNNFELIDLGYDEESVQFEVNRCLQCNLRMYIKSNPHPPSRYLEFTVENINTIQRESGVIQLLDANKNVSIIKGSDNIKDTLINFYNNGKEAQYFTFEYDPLFSKRESELIQQHLQKYGSMPDSGDELDDLF
jgi:NADPH-dependent glutamate synthase beta subunit-like oxidoreductase